MPNRLAGFARSHNWPTFCLCANTENESQMLKYLWNVLMGVLSVVTVL